VTTQIFISHWTVGGSSCWVCVHVYVQDRLYLMLHCTHLSAEAVDFVIWQYVLLHHVVVSKKGTQLLASVSSHGTYRNNLALTSSFTPCSGLVEGSLRPAVKLVTR
jgi:hypothetical protein